MRRPRVQIGVWGLMVAVALAAGLLAWRQYRAYEMLRREYVLEAIECGFMEEVFWRNANITQEQWLERCREVVRKNEEGTDFISGGARAFFREPDPPELERRRAEYFGRRKAKFERASLRPWQPVGPEEPYPQ